MAASTRNGLVSRSGVAELLDRYSGRPGARLLRAFLERDRGYSLTRSEAESRFLALIRRGGIKDPEVNVPLRGFEVDFLWRRERLVVEIDGFAYHSSSVAFERDRRRDALLATSGFQVIRLTWRQLTEEPEVSLVLVAQALAVAAQALAVAAQALAVARVD